MLHLSISFLDDSGNPTDAVVDVPLSDAQESALRFQRNVENVAVLPGNEPHTLADTASLLITRTLTGIAGSRSEARRQRGLALYAGAAPEVQAEINAKVGLNPEWPTGNPALDTIA